MTEIDALLVERKQQHGDFSDHARITQALKRTMWVEAGIKWEQMTDTQREALEMIQHKIGRILAGDPNHADHWRDIAGYAKITEERLVSA